MRALRDIDQGVVAEVSTSVQRARRVIGTVIGQVGRGRQPGSDRRSARRRRGYCVSTTSSISLSSSSTLAAACGAISRAMASTSRQALSHHAPDDAADVARRRGGCAAAGCAYAGLEAGVRSREHASNASTERGENRDRDNGNKDDDQRVLDKALPLMALPDCPPHAPPEHLRRRHGDRPQMFGILTSRTTVNRTTS
jgi:hypothetical protein